jgi:hypothetical protein
MANRKKDLMNPLAGIEEEAVEAARPASRSAAYRRKKELDNPLNTVNAGEIRRAVHPEGKDTTMAGRYRRRSILVEPEMDEAINQKVEDLGVGKMELVRFLLAVGLAQLNSGQVVPAKQKVVAIKLEMPDWRVDG